MEYLTSNEIAIKRDISSRIVRKFCSEERAIGEVQKGNLWLIPNTTLNPKSSEGAEKGSMML